MQRSRTRPPFSAVVTSCALTLLCAACGSTAVSVTAPEPKCQIAVGATSISAPSNGATGQIAISATRDCTWSASASAAWVVLTSATSGQGSGSLSYRVDTNAQPSSRTAVVDVNGTPVSVVQDGAPCTFNVSPRDPSVGAEAGSLTVSVTALSGCAWTAATGEPWVHVSEGATGSGNGTVRLTIDANSGADRVAHVRVGDQDVNITQAAGSIPAPAPIPPPAPAPAPSPPPPPAPAPQPCRYTLSATMRTMTEAGGPDTVAVETTNGCAWTAKSNTPWLTIVKGTSGTHSDVVTYSATPNTGVARSGTLTIAGQTVTVTQRAPLCIYSIAPSSLDVGARGGSGSTNLTTTPGCAWTSVSNVSWITLTSGFSGNGNGTVEFTVAANTGAARIGSFTAAGVPFIVSQAAAP